MRRVGFGNNLRSGLGGSSCELGAALIPSAATAGEGTGGCGAAEGCACAGDLGSPGDPARPPTALCSNLACRREGWIIKETVTKKLAEEVSITLFPTSKYCLGILSRLLLF